MAHSTGSSFRVSPARLVLLGVVVVAGLILFFALGPKTQTVVIPEVEARP
ncbi:MAG TPA: hypothetical protein VF187_10160 [Gemmatimonadales bacterium]